MVAGGPKAMAANIEIPQEFGGSWAAFCEQWCPEGSLGYSAEEVSCGLTTLKRLWPKKFAENLGQGRGGTWVPTISTEAGLLLAVSEHAKFFRGVLDRLKAGQRSAYSELVVGWALRALGYDPQFESGEREPDLLCEINGAPVAFEVYAPEDSQASQDQQALVKTLELAANQAMTSSRVEIGILESFGQADIHSAVRAIQEAPASTWVRVGAWAQIRRTDEGQTLLPTFDGVGAQLSVMGDTDVKGPGKSVTIRWERIDTRARLSLERKRAQVRNGVRNAVVIDVCAVGGVAEWPYAIAQLPGPDFNKIGAVLSFHQGCLGPPERVRRRWSIVENPFAVLSLPDELLSGIESLDESKYYGLEPKPRLSFARSQ
jgi:hypothetical protein